MRANVGGVDVGAFAGVDGSLLLVASNTLGVPVPHVTIKLEGGAPGVAQSGTATARVLFGPAFREVEVEVEVAGAGSAASFADTIDAMGTRVYLLEADGPSCRNSAPWYLQRALLTPQLVPGSLIAVIRAL